MGRCGGRLGDEGLVLRCERSGRPLVGASVDDHRQAHLAYVVELFADAPNGGSPTRPFVVVDAMSGTVLDQWDGLTTADIGTGPGGNQKTGQYE